MSERQELTPKLWVRDTDKGRYYLLWCTACKCGHVIPTPRWGYNDNSALPTFTPSVKITAPPTDYCCHFNVTDGKIQYHGDCNHSLRGQLIDMVDIPVEYGF